MTVHAEHARELHVLMPDDPFARARWTLSEMIRLVREGLRDSEIVLLARRLVLEAGAGRDVVRQAAALLQAVRERVAYLEDPFDVEFIRSPRQVLEGGAGDCEEQTIALATLAASIGIPVRLVAARPSPEDPEWRHVWTELLIGSQWVAADASVPEAPLGWRPRPSFDLLIARLS